MFTSCQLIIEKHTEKEQTHVARDLSPNSVLAAAVSRRRWSLGWDSSPLGWGSLGALSETVLGSSCNMFQVSHSASAFVASSLCLLGPVIYEKVIYERVECDTYISSSFDRGDQMKRMPSFVCARFVYRWFCSGCGSCCCDRPWKKYLSSINTQEMS